MTPETDDESAPTVLIIEDGNEYLENLSRFVSGPRYLQARSGQEALAVLSSNPVDVVYLDMRFDRVPPETLLGDLGATAERFNGDQAKALRHLQNNQGLYILDHLDRHGFVDTPVVIAYDFSRETRRFQRLKKRHPNLDWVSDAVTPSQIRRKLYSKQTSTG